MASTKSGGFPLRCLALAWLLLLGSPAWADAPPAVQPLRDVDVTYRVPVRAATETALLQRLRWSASRRLQRVDLPTSGNWMVLDFAAHRMAMVRDESREVVDLPAPEGIDKPASGAGFARQGQANVAGLACTEWRTTDTRGQQTFACYTDDGVLLRAREAGAEGRVLMEAVSVAYTTQDASVFATPDGYTHQAPGR